MFVELANLAAAGEPGANTILTEFRPLQVLDFLEGYWQSAAPALQAPPDEARGQDLDQPILTPPNLGLPLHHLAYAYMLENTRLIDIMRRVVWEYRHGERLPPPTGATQRWLHVTEELFFTSPLPYSVRSVTSSLRPDPAAVRRNAYYRLLGMDLNHGTEDGRPYPYVKADAANRDFAMLFEALLTELWKGYANRSNLVAENTTDDPAILELTRRLREMLNARRLAVNLAREEFDAVATLSWFYLVVAYNTQIVRNLNADADGVSDRLRLIGQRVGVPAHARSDAYFQMARPMSVVLRAIEQDAIATAGGPQSLYDGLYTPEVVQLIVHWSIATGRNLKDPTLRQPLGVLAATGSGGMLTGGNGAGAGVGGVNRIAVALR